MNDKEKEFSFDNTPIIEQPSREVLNQLTKNTAVTTGPLLGFVTIEHKEAGDKAFKAFIHDSQNAALLKALVDNGLCEPAFSVLYLYSTKDPSGKPLTLTAGEWIAYAGDLYGVPHAPISMSITDSEKNFKLQKRTSDDAEKCFEAAYNTLANYPDLKGKEQLAAQGKMEAIRSTVEHEKKIVNKALTEHKSIEEALEAYAAEGNKQYGNASLYNRILKYLPLGYIHSEYVALAQHNIDHFGEQAQQAYAAGHAVALETARLAHLASNEQLKYRLLLRAITQELFACHFLTDLFAAGHMRTPRASLLSFIHNLNTFHKLQDDIKLGVTAGFLAEAMHNEDNHHGLQVTSQAHPTPWTAYGDHCYYETGEQTNNEHMQEAVQAALQSIARTFASGIKEQAEAYNSEKLPTEQPYDFHHYIPTPTKENFPALFITHETQVFMRAKLHLKEGEVCSHIPNWSPTFLLIKTKKLPGVREKDWRKVCDVLEEVKDGTEIVASVADALKEVVKQGIDQMATTTPSCSFM
jgi:hypothetical protein